MRSPFTLLGAAIGLCGSAMLVLGLVIWAGAADSLIPVHMLLGFVIVALLWALVALAISGGLAVARALPVLVMSLVMPAFGLLQESLLSGDGHVVVQLVHLAIGITTLALAGRLAAAARREAGTRDATA